MQCDALLILTDYIFLRLIYQGLRNCVRQLFILELYDITSTAYFGLYKQIVFHISDTFCFSIRHISFFYCGLHISGNHVIRMTYRKVLSESSSALGSEVVRKACLGAKFQSPCAGVWLTNCKACARDQPHTHRSYAPKERKRVSSLGIRFVFAVWQNLFTGGLCDRTHTHFYGDTLHSIVSPAQFSPMW